MMRLTRYAPHWRIMVALMILLGAFAATAPASANVNTLLLGRRNCESVSAYVLYDGYSVGTTPYLAAFAIDLNGNGVYGEAEAGERTLFSKVGPNTGTAFGKATFRFPAVPEGTEISVTAYELDSGGRQTSKQLSPVRFTCTNAPQTNQIPAGAPFIVPNVAVSARVTTSYRLAVYDSPKGDSSEEIGGLPTGALVTAIGRNSRGDWLQIAFNGGTGWIMWNTNALVFGPYRSLPVTAK